jgi:hypothetical protein
MYYKKKLKNSFKCIIFVKIKSNLNQFCLKFIEILSYNANFNEKFLRNLIFSFNKNLHNQI